jgi:hypothetical protein
MDFCKKVVVEYSKHVRHLKVRKTIDTSIWVARNPVDI